MLKNKLYTIGKEYHFDAAHFLPGHPMCGKTHGHTWTIEVQITGFLNADNMVLDFHTLNFLTGPIIASMDHTLLNDLMLNPTVEFISYHIASALAGALDTYNNITNIETITVKVKEGKGGYSIAQVSLKES